MNKFSIKFNRIAESTFYLFYLVNILSKSKRKLNYPNLQLILKEQRLNPVYYSVIQNTSINKFQFSLRNFML